MPAVRRFVTTLLLLCFASYGLEAAAADVHEGHGPATQLISDPGSNLGNHPLRDQGGPNPTGDGHSFHVCHCTHSHAGVVAIAPVPTAQVHPTGQLTWHKVAFLPSILRAPPLRPPIV